jgi:single-stranded-DNA-specific exonuclease
VPFDQINLDLADQLRRLAPFGNGNPEPLLLTRNITVHSDRRVGVDGSHRRLQFVQGDGKPVTAMWFRGGDADLPAGPLDLAYHLKVNDYRGRRSEQLHFVAARPAQPDEVVVQGRPASTVAAYDWRDKPLEKTELPAKEVSVWYAEGVGLGEEDYAPRHKIGQAQRGQPLILWTSPPSRALLIWLLETVQPSMVHVVARDGTDLSRSELLRSVGRMCTHALQNQDGVIDIERMAARLGTTETVIRYSLTWLDAAGTLQKGDWLSGDNLSVAPGTGVKSPPAQVRAESKIDDLLTEIRAYRRNFRKSPLKQLGLG